jgi:hypothetical protein
MDVAIGDHRRARGAARVAADRAARFERTPFATTSLALRSTARPESLRRVLLQPGSACVRATCPRYITGQILAVDGGEGVGA